MFVRLSVRHVFDPRQKKEHAYRANLLDLHISVSMVLYVFIMTACMLHPKGVFQMFLECAASWDVRRPSGQLACANSPDPALLAFILCPLQLLAL